MALVSHHGEMMLGPYTVLNMTASSHHDESLGSYSLFNMRASFKHDGSLGPYNFFNGHVKQVIWHKASIMVK
jgi:hypothetical protein